jgi:hypothetical protein
MTETQGSTESVRHLFSFYIQVLTAKKLLITRFSDLFRLRDTCRTYLKEFRAFSILTFKLS